MPREDSYDHITVVQPMKQCVTLETVLVEADGRRVLMPDLRSLTSKLKPSHTDDGDCKDYGGCQRHDILTPLILVMSALATALQMIEVFCKHLKYKKKIVIVTNGTGLMDASDLTDMIDKINKDAIELVVLYASLSEQWQSD